MKTEGLVEIAKSVYTTKDENALVFLESVFRVIFIGEFDKEWLDKNVKREFEEISSLDAYYYFLELFEFEFDKYDSVIINNKLIDDMLELAILLSIYVEFEFNFYYFINYKRDFISLIINNGNIYFSGFKVHSELNFITNEIDELIYTQHENFEIRTLEEIKIIKYKVKTFLSSKNSLDYNIVESWKLIEEEILLKNLDLLIDKYTYVTDPITKELTIPIIIKYVPLYNKDTNSLDIVRLRLIQTDNNFKWNFDQVQSEIKFFFQRS